MKNLLFIGLALFLFSCKKNTEEILNNDLRNQINASIKEVKANLEEFTTLKKEGKIIFAIHQKINFNFLEKDKDKLITENNNLKTGLKWVGGGFVGTLISLLTIALVK